MAKVFDYGDGLKLATSALATQGTVATSGTVDGNNLTEQFVYNVQATAVSNLPAKTGSLINIRNTDNRVQLFISEDSSPVVFIRKYISSSWTSWGRVTSETDQKLIDLAVLGWSVPDEMPVKNYVDSDRKFHQKVGRVDLGTLTWNSQVTNDNSKKRMRGVITLKGYPTNQIGNLLCAKYATITDNTAGTYGCHEGISVGSDGEYVHIYDENYNTAEDVDSFKTAMNGVYLYYELADEVVIDLDGNEVDVLQNGRLDSAESRLESAEDAIDAINDARGVANGIATLDENGKVPLSQMSDTPQVYKGAWNASTNTPTLADGTGTAGYYYIVSVAGTWNGVAFYINDRIMYNGDTAKWERLGGGSVTSVAGRTGAVVLNKADVGLGNVPNVTTDNQTPGFTEAQARANIVSGETLSVIFGKIKKIISDFINHVNATNPHNITKSTVGLGNVDNTADASKSVASAANADKVNNHTVNSDVPANAVFTWRPLGTGANDACAGNDSRLSDARTPTTHNHSAANITSGTLAVSVGGTGKSALASTAYTTLEYRGESLHTSDTTPSSNGCICWKYQ